MIQMLGSQKSLFVKRLFVFCLLFVVAGNVLAVDVQNGTARDITPSLQIKTGGFRKDLKTGELVQAVTVTNISRQAIAGDLYLVMNDLEPGIAVTSKARRAALGDRAEKAFALDFPHDKTQGLKPGQQLTTVLRFAASDKSAVRYQPRVLQQNINNK